MKNKKIIFDTAEEAICYIKYNNLKVNNLDAVYKYFK